MSNQIEIETNAYCINHLLERISSEMGESDSDQVKLTATEVVSNCIDVYSQTFGAGDVGLAGSGGVGNLHKSSIPDGTTGLIYGKVQSGKTIATIATLALASANNFKCFIVLTSDNTWLGKQTASRFSHELVGGPVIYDWESWRKDPKSFGQRIKSYMKDTGVVLVSTKNIRHLEGLLEVLKSSESKAVPSLIFDDEADNASLNTNEAKQSKKGKLFVPDSSIFEVIGKIRKQIPNHIYLQITATPQSILLQSLSHPCKPAFCVLSKPGESYMGGDLFFNDKKSHFYPFDLNELTTLKGGIINPGNSSDIPKGLRLALCCFFLGAVYKMLESDNPKEKYSCLIHICYKRINHKHIEEVIRLFVEQVDQALRDQLSRTSKEEAIRYLAEAHTELKKTAHQIPPLEDLVEELKHKLRNAIPKVINADNPNKQPDYNPGMNILIGGNRLGRGVTIDGLMITYYGRDAKQKMVDTVHQHARMFGYRQKLKDVTRLFTPDHIFNDFCVIHESDEGMRKVIGNNPDQLSIKPVWIGTTLKPTRSNVLDPSEINAFTPGISTFPRAPMWKKNDVKIHAESLEQLLSAYSDDEIYYEVSIDFLVEILRHIPSRPIAGYVWEDRRVSEALKAMKEQKDPKIPNGRLNVRRGRQGKGLGLKRRDSWGKNGFFTSSWMKKAKDTYPDVPTLVIGYEKGDVADGWDNHPLYLPTLVFPQNKFVFMFNYSE
jgi:hypothetical protein